MLSANELIAQIISFLILLTLLRIFAWKKVLALLDARKERIASEFKKAEDSRIEALKLQAQYSEKLADIENEARQKIQDAIAMGRNITEEVRKNAHEEAQQIIKNAKAHIEHELDVAKEELKDRIIDLTIAAAETVIESKLTEADDRKIINDFLEGLDQVNEKG